ncbi:MAG: lipid-A-disaccharide synthase N-terminal domain-containing protein [Limisphaerales bacterium]
MDWLTDIFWHNHKLLHIDWSIWKVVGWLGNLVFFSRFMVQWYATEKRKQVVVPTAFWWLSLTGALLLLIYAVNRHDSVFIFAYAFTWIPYVRNLIIHRRHVEAHVACPKCAVLCAPQSNFCSACGTRLRQGKLSAATGST